ncbi:ABC transporter ATP-binding protein [Sporanaerobacter acetigenes]|uniref:ATP-binding cassette, subfamily B, MsbA n=1 Tax=Sporanaerobacter acetigenes DSM 13106 TaxID=1123281 RepID=A0A1M5UIP0_9FIRM|nr:ABC transporter ATP-binding protein [Sporanaerobacter acetigenes]SHH62791.1 ATP-binding cassette, subfamily B, MsbA [Sporanaerobacter acetigenes DSM 13106]
MKSEKFDFELLKRMLKYLVPFKKRLWLIIVCFALSTVVGFFQPLTIRSITDDGMAQKNLKVIIYSVLILLGLVLVNQLLEVLQAKLFIDIHNESEFLLSHQAFNKLLHLKTEYFNDKNNSEIINSLQMDVSNVSAITDRFMAVNISYIFRVISGVAGLIIISWKLTIIVLAMAPIKYFTVLTLSKRKGKKTEELIENYRDFSAWFDDNIGGVKEIKLWNLYNKRYKTFEKKQKNILKISKESTMLDTWNVFYEIMLEWSVTGLLYILGGILIVNGSLTIGGVFAFLSYSSYVTGPISSILNIRYFFSRIFPSAKRFFSFLDMEEETNFENSIEVKNESQNIQFKNVSFSYEENREVLKNINFVFSKGEKVAIIGANGSGKTTILDLLLRFIEPSSGEICIGDKNINQISIAKYRSLFSVVSQEPYLFHDTVLNNINLDGNAGKEKVEKACRQSGASEFINKLPKKENSKIGKNGARLSGGEKQKIAVARAIVKYSPIVILDEATSGYDVESDSYLHDVILNELKNKSVIMITHRYDNLEGMDKVYRLSEGRLVEMNKLKKSSEKNIDYI